MEEGQKSEKQKKKMKKKYLTEMSPFSDKLWYRKNEKGWYWIRRYLNSKKQLATWNVLKQSIQTCGHSGERRGKDESRGQHWNIHITMCKTDSQREFVLWCRELKPGALWQPRGVGGGGRWEGGSRGRGHVHTNGWFMLIRGRDQHNIVEQLPSN